MRVITAVAAHILSMTTKNSYPAQHLIVAISGLHSISAEIQGAPVGALDSLPYVLRATLRSVSLSGLFSAVKLTVISPGLVWADFGDVAVDHGFAETVAREVRNRWAMVHGLDPVSVTHVTVDRT